MTAGSPSSPPKVLVADDSESERASARSALNSAGYQVVEAIDGQHALEVFARERPDLVMLDVSMPRLDGVQALRRLRDREPELRAILVSGYGDEDLHERTSVEGVPLLRKPYRIDELERILVAQLGA